MGQYILIDILDYMMQVQKLNLVQLIHDSDGALSVGFPGEGTVLT